MDKRIGVHWLLLDAGNSALKWAVVNTAIGFPALAHGWVLNQPVDTLTQRLIAAWHAAGLQTPPHAAYACRVASDALARAAEAATLSVWNTRPRWLAAQAECALPGAVSGRAIQLRNGYRNPAQLGADRWHALIAARGTYPDEAVVVVNSGTATTVDCLRADGVFAGGVIAPGLRLMFESLERNTAQLPLADWSDAVVPTHPDNTETAIAGGVLGAQIGMIERSVRRFQHECGPVHVLLGGGQAARLAGWLTADGVKSVAVDDNLVLRGVYLRARALNESSNA